MAAMFGNTLGSFHSDVLSAQPTDEEGKTKLVEEIKNRAKGSLTSKNYPEAIQLYSKGIEIKPNDSILFANRSMCFLSMGKNDEALSDAEQSVHYDPSYAKGYFRKGSALVALKNYSSATEAFQRGLDLAPGDKSFLTQLQKLQTISHSSQSSVIEPTLSSSVRAAQPVTKSSHSAAASKVENDDEPSETGVFRGYKKTSDGRTTTFFNNELDDETKALIGDIAPKKIEVDIISQHAPSSSGESVWNKAGTWEERIHTPWATSRLKELLGGISFPISDSICGNGSIYLKNISLSGDAQVTMARGKVKHIYDFSGTADWVMEVSSSDDATGTVTLEDISGDQDYDIQVTVGQRGDSHSSQLVNQFVKNSSQGLQSLIISTLRQFHDEFQMK